MSEPKGPPPDYTPTAGQPGYPPQPQTGYAPQPYSGYAPQAQQGYAPQTHPGFAPQHHSTSTSNVVVVNQPGTTIAPGACRACGGGVITDNFTCCGICLAIWFFPLGLICCFLMMEKRCANCGIRYG